MNSIIIIIITISIINFWFNCVFGVSDTRSRHYLSLVALFIVFVVVLLVFVFPANYLEEI